MCVKTFLRLSGQHQRAQYKLQKGQCILSYLSIIPPQCHKLVQSEPSQKDLRCVSEEWLIGRIMCVLRTLDSLHTQSVNLSILFLMLFVALVTVIHKCCGTVRCGYFRVQPAVVGLVDSRGGELVIAQHRTTQVNNSTFKHSWKFLSKVFLEFD